jgi:hypothetical protein
VGGEQLHHLGHEQEVSAVEHAELEEMARNADRHLEKLVTSEGDPERNRSEKEGKVVDQELGWRPLAVRK